MKLQIGLVIVLLVLFNNASVLNVFGYMVDYNNAGFSLFKLMPATYLIFFLALRRSNTIILYYKRSSFAVKFFLWTTIIVTLTSNFITKSPGNIYIVNCLLAGVLLYLLLLTDKAENVEFYFKVLLICFFINVFFAYIEKYTVHSIFKQVQIQDSGQKVLVKDEEFRSTSFLGHPLNNALIISTLTIFFFLNIKNKVFGYAVLISGLLAILCFGARGALFSILIILFIKLSFSTKAKQLKFSLANIFLGITGISFFLMVILLLIQNSSLGSRILSIGLSFDDASSSTRFVILKVFDVIDISNYIFSGVTANELDLIMFRLDLFSLENFWIIWLLKYGIVLFFLLSISLIKFCLNISKNMAPVIRVCLLSIFLIVASVNNSLAGSTSAFSIFILCIYLSINLNNRELKQPVLTVKKFYI